jgi:hypothetical protein
VDKTFQIKGAARGFILLFAAGAAAPALAGPFGLTQGAPLSKLQVVKKSSGEHRYVINVPSPLSDFDFYIATVTPVHGLCRVAAMGETLTDDANGAKARTKYEHLKGLLDSKYGASRQYDFLHAGSVWKLPSQFATSIDKKERTLQAFWTAENSSRLPSDIGAINLEVAALSATETYVNVIYELANHDACFDYVKNSKAQSL